MWGRGPPHKGDPTAGMGVGDTTLSLAASVTLPNNSALGCDALVSGGSTTPPHQLIDLNSSLLLGMVIITLLSLGGSLIVSAGLGQHTHGERSSLASL